MPVELKGELVVNISSRSHEVKEELIANVSTIGTDINGANSTNISSNSRVEVHEGADITLTFVMEAYPPIRQHHWTTPTSINNDDSTVYQESYTADSYRLAH